jgi:hypothetical protein
MPRLAEIGRALKSSERHGGLRRLTKSLLSTALRARPYTPAYTIFRFLLSLVTLVHCRISNLLIVRNRIRFESRPLRQLLIDNPKNSGWAHPRI